MRSSSSCREMRLCSLSCNMAVGLAMHYKHKCQGHAESAVADMFCAMKALPKRHLSHPAVSLQAFFLLRYADAACHWVSECQLMQVPGLLHAFRARH
jgi:hypothetical protein